jgi:tetratricopeptide (TPR) repeat protein
VHRNLGIAYYNKQEDSSAAVESFEKAFALDDSDARLFMELDQLYKRTNKDPEARLEDLENHSDLIEQRDDLYLERAALYNFQGEYEKAYELIMSRTFHPVEGGEGMVSDQYVYSLTEMAKKDLRNDDCEEALEKLEAAQQYPHSLGEGKLFGTRENDIFYWMGVAHEKLGNADEAETYWQKATEGDYEPTAAVFYNDQAPEKIFYQALAWQKLGEEEKAHQIYRELIEYGEEHMEDEVQIDYFAVSLPDLLTFDADLCLRNNIHCKLMMGLGYLGLDKISEAESLFKEILDAEAMHTVAKTHLKLADWIGSALDDSLHK